MRTSKQLGSIVFVALALLLSPAIYAGNMEPSAPPGPTMKTLDEVEPRIPIGQADIPKTINTSGSYYLTEDVIAVGTAIIVDHNDVTIDLKGYTITGPDLGINYGIFMNGCCNVEIRNGTIRDFYFGIDEVSNSAQDCRVIAVRAVSNGYNGIYLDGNSHLVKGCTASDNGETAAGANYGIYANYGSTVTGNTVYNNGFLTTGNSIGIKVNEGSTVTGNTVYGNGHLATGNSFGIFANIGSTVTGNTVYNNGNSAGGSVFGIWLSGYSLVDQNTAYNNGMGAGSATNITLGVVGCVYGNNVAP